MHPDNPDLTARGREIKSLQLVIAKNAAMIEASRLILIRMEEKQIARRAELRCQELMLKRAQWLATKREIESTVARMTE